MRQALFAAALGAVLLVAAFFALYVALTWSVA